MADIDEDGCTGVLNTLRGCARKVAFNCLLKPLGLNYDDTTGMSETQEDVDDDRSSRADLCIYLKRKHNGKRKVLIEVKTVTNRDLTPSERNPDNRDVWLVPQDYKYVDDIPIDAIVYWEDLFHELDGDVSAFDELREYLGYKDVRTDEEKEERRNKIDSIIKYVKKNSDIRFGYPDEGNDDCGWYWDIPILGIDECLNFDNWGCYISYSIFDSWNKFDEKLSGKGGDPLDASSYNESYPYWDTIFYSLKGDDIDTLGDLIIEAYNRYNEIKEALNADDDCDVLNNDDDSEEDNRGVWNVFDDDSAEDSNDDWDSSDDDSEEDNNGIRNVFDDDSEEDIIQLNTEKIVLNDSDDDSVEDSNDDWDSSDDDNDSDIWNSSDDDDDSDDWNSSDDDDWDSSDDDDDWIKF